MINYRTSSLGIPISFGSVVRAQGEDCTVTSSYFTSLQCRVSLSLALSLFLSLFFSLFLALSFSLSLPISLSLSLPFSLSFFLSRFLSIFLSRLLSFFPPCYIPTLICRQKLSQTTLSMISLCHHNCLPRIITWS